MKPYINNYGYLRISLSVDGKRHKYSIHRLVALLFIDNPYNKKEVNHIDGNKLNNVVTNLEWVTSSENQLHAERNNLTHHTPVCGSDNHWTKYSDKQIHMVCKLLENNKLSIPEIGKKTNVSRGVVGSIQRHECWKHISKLYNIDNFDKLKRKVIK